jgi:hypothetical protein
MVSLAALVVASGACVDFDTSRQTPPRGSLGREMYTMVCDRVGAQALREDVTGGSFHDVCHANADGAFADKVDITQLPGLDPDAHDVDGNPVPYDTQEKNRLHRIARIEALARRRDDLIGAFDTAFANENIATKDLGNPDPLHTCDPPSGDGVSGEADLRKELADMLGRLTDLYNDDTIPDVTRALSHVMDGVSSSNEAQQALARFDARRGYRPTDIAMGVPRPALAYPRFVELSNALLRLLSSDTDPLGLTLPPDAPHKKAADRIASDRKPGLAHDALVSMLGVTREELKTSKAIADLPPLVTQKDARDPYLVAISRPRGNLELARAILLSTDPAYSIGDPRWVVARDQRGVARVQLDASGKLPAPFVDKNGDGLADLDDVGRFLTSNGDAPLPFLDWQPSGQVTRDAFGRAMSGGQTTYEYIDVSSTYLGSLSRDLTPLLEPDPGKQHETIMDLLAGLYIAAGKREGGEDSLKKYDDGTSLKYRAYREDSSPLIDLVWGVGQVFADPTTDDTLALVQRLAQDKPQVLARLIGIGLQIKAIADKHPEAQIPESSTLWDEMLDVLVQISQQPALIEAIIRGFQDDRVLDLPRSAVAYMSMRDHLQYDRNDLNGLPFNVNTGKVDSLVTPVDRGQPDTGWNKSAFQRFLQILHETNGLSTCTKEGAVAHIVWKGLPMDFPGTLASGACVILGSDAPPDPMPICGMFRVENIASNIVDAVLGEVKLDIRNDCLRNLISSPLTGIVGGADSFLEEVSGIKGWNTKPSVAAVSRMVFLDLPHDGLPGDTQNTHTTNFFKDLFDPTETLVCPPRPFTDTDGHVLNLRTCSRFEDSLRGRDLDSLFPVEELGFLTASIPLAKAFHDNNANLLFIQLFDRLAVHWGSDKQTKDECDPSLPHDNAKWCPQDGAVSYEPLLAEALGKTDLFQTLHDSSKELAGITIPHCDTRDPKTGACTHSTNWDGVKVMAEALKAMVDPARNQGLKQRNGDAGVTRNDGSRNQQVTPIYLLIDALKGFDARFKEEPARLPQWRRARSQLVDQLFAIDGTGADSKFRNPAAQKLIPTLVSTLRSQIAAHCPDPGTSCDWARKELPGKVKDTVTGPSFATSMDLLDKIVSDTAARTELERLLQFLLESAQSDAQKTTLTALADIMQIFEDDANLTALLHAGADAAGPEVIGDDGHVADKGLFLASIDVLARILGEQHDAQGNRICGKEIDPNRTLAVVLRRLVTPPGDGKPPPIEVLMDVVADVNRRQPERTDKLVADDYASISSEISDFCSNKTRGLEQVYTVIKQATHDL